MIYLSLKYWVWYWQVFKLKISLKKKLFLIFGNTDILFGEHKLTWKFFTLTRALLIIKKTKIIDQKKSIKVFLDLTQETFVIHGPSLNPKILIHLALKAHIALLIINYKNV